MKLKHTILFLIPLLMCACFEDKGNYEYRQMPVITIEEVPSLIEVLGNSEHIVISPRISSDQEGVIAADDPNYEFKCMIETKTNPTLVEGKRWVSLNPAGNMAIDTLATFPARNYIGYYSVTDRRTGIEHFKTFEMNVTSPTYEGWMVWSDYGPDNRARLDMVSILGQNRIVPAYDLLLNAPRMQNATKIGFAPTTYHPGDIFYLFSETGGYQIDRENFTTDESWNIKSVDFIVPPEDDEVINYYSHYYFQTNQAQAIFAITKKGNAYVLLTGSAGAAFESPINTSVRGGEPEYRVAPFAASCVTKPSYGQGVLFYDMDNRRFVGWRYGTTVNARHTLTPVSEFGQETYFSFDTGMELLHMEATTYSNGLVYSVLQDDSGDRHVYGINMSFNGFRQESVYENITAPDFDKATKFAFHSQFPFMFYAAGNKVYLYNLGTSETTLLTDIDLGANEEVTLLKFNLYMQPQSILANKTDEFWLRQYELMVGSYGDTPDHNGGKLGFYPVNGTSSTVSKRAEYTGFGRIRDVVYRERR